MNDSVRRVYGGLCLLERGGGYELHEDGALLARTDKPEMADKLFFKRALDIAGGRVAAGERAQVALTAVGKARLCGGMVNVTPSDADVSAPSSDFAASERRVEGVEEPVKRFRKPTVEEVAAYIAEKGYISDPQAFYDYHESAGWKVGKKSMRDWRAACRTWEHKEKEKAAREERRQTAPKQYVAVTNPPESSLDFEQLEQELLHYRPKFVPPGKDGETNGIVAAG